MDSAVIPPEYMINYLQGMSGDLLLLSLNLRVAI